MHSTKETDVLLIADPGDLKYPLRIFAEKAYVYRADMGVRDWHFPSQAVINYWKRQAVGTGQTFACHDMDLRFVFQIIPLGPDPCGDD